MPISPGVSQSKSQHSGDREYGGTVRTHARTHTHTHTDTHTAHTHTHAHTSLVVVGYCTHTHTHTHTSSDGGVLYTHAHTHIFTCIISLQRSLAVCGKVHSSPNPEALQIIQKSQKRLGC